MRYVAVVACMLLGAGLVRADAKPNPTGSWKYTADIGGQSVDVTIKLKLDGDKLTGTVSSRDMESKIEDAKYKDGTVSFKVNREIGGNKIVLKYSGTIKGDTFKGKRELDRDGQTNSREFEAKRVKE